MGAWDYFLDSTLHLDVRIAEYLLQGAWKDVNLKTKYGFTPLIHICAASDVNASVFAVLNMILSHDEVDVNAHDDDGTTALEMATGRSRHGGNIEMTRMLLSHPNIDVNAKGDNGDTALTWALQWMNSKSCVRELLLDPRTDISPEAYRLCRSLAKRCIFKFYVRCRGVCRAMRGMFPRDILIYIVKHEYAMSVTPDYLLPFACDILGVPREVAHKHNHLGSLISNIIQCGGIYKESNIV